MKRLLLAAAITALILAGAQAQIWIMTNGGAGGGKASHVMPTCAGVIDASIGCPLPMLGM